MAPPPDPGPGPVDPHLARIVRRVGDDLHACALTALSRMRRVYRNGSNVTNLARLGWSLLRESSYGTQETDKDGGCVRMSKQSIAEEKEKILAGPNYMLMTSDPTDDALQDYFQTCKSLALQVNPLTEKKDVNLAASNSALNGIHCIRRLFTMPDYPECKS